MGGSTSGLHATGGTVSAGPSTPPAARARGAGIPSTPRAAAGEAAALSATSAAAMRVMGPHRRLQSLIGDAIQVSGPATDDKEAAHHLRCDHSRAERAGAGSIRWHALPFELPFARQLFERPVLRVGYVQPLFLC
jgi:hypothetical protein